MRGLSHGTPFYGNCVFDCHAYYLGRVHLSCRFLLAPAGWTLGLTLGTLGCQTLYLSCMAGLQPFLVLLLVCSATPAGDLAFGAVARPAHLRVDHFLLACSGHTRYLFLGASCNPRAMDEIKQAGISRLSLWCCRCLLLLGRATRWITLICLLCNPRGDG